MKKYLLIYNEEVFTTNVVTIGDCSNNHERTGV